MTKTERHDDHPEGVDIGLALAFQITPLLTVGSIFLGASPGFLVVEMALCALFLSAFVHHSLMLCRPLTTVLASVMYAIFSIAFVCTIDVWGASRGFPLNQMGFYDAVRSWFWWPQ